MVSAGDDGSVRIWHFKSDMRPLKFDFHKGAVHAVAFNDDGGYVASGGADGKICLTKNNAKNEGIHFKGHSAPVKSVNFSKDGNRLLTSGDDKTIKLWHLNHKRGPDQIRKVTGHEFLKSYLGHTDWVLESRFSPDNRVIASACCKSVWKIHSGASMGRQHRTRNC